MDAADLWDEIRKLGTRSGLDRIGVCSADPFPEVASEMARRRVQGLADGLPFTYSDPERSADVRRSLPWAHRIVAAGRSYLPQAGDPGPARPGWGRVARFAVDDAYRPLRAGLVAVADRLTAAGHRAEVLADDSRLVDRAAAVRAGIGWWGKNTMVLDPGVGPWMLLGSVVTDAELPIAERSLRDCGACSACIPACPTGALTDPGVLDARLCLAAAAQGRGSIPSALRGPMGDRVYGCDDCLVACPPGDRARSGTLDRRGRVDLVELLGSTDEALLARFPWFYLPSRKARYLRRNVLVALGNGGLPEHVPLLAGYLGSPDPMLRGHAAWALGRIGDRLAVGILREARGGETDRDVIGEIDAALRMATSAGSEREIGEVAVVGHHPVAGEVQEG